MPNTARFLLGRNARAWFSPDATLPVHAQYAPGMGIPTSSPGSVSSSDFDTWRATLREASEVSGLEMQIGQDYQSLPTHAGAKYGYAGGFLGPWELRVGFGLLTMPYDAPQLANPTGDQFNIWLPKKWAARTPISMAFTEHATTGGWQANTYVNYGFYGNFWVKLEGKIEDERDLQRWRFSLYCHNFAGFGPI